ncbi:MAG: 4-alpha-glucanotransferase, partial [Nocardioides sp.]
ATRFPVHIPHGSQVQVAVRLPDGAEEPVAQVDHWVDPRDVDGTLVGEATFELAAELPLGYHTLIARGEHGLVAEATVISVPDRLALPRALRDRRIWGVLAQIYQVRSSGSWGIGDLGDLGTLAEWAGKDLGADFVLVNPLHAAQTAPMEPMEPSPYLPTTRRFANPVYLDVRQLPGLEALGHVEKQAVEALAEAASSLNLDDTIDRDAAWTLKRQALWRVYGGHPERAGLRRFVKAEGEGLTAYATWCAIAERFGQDVPADLADADQAAVERFRAAHVDEIDFHCWLQWQLARQLKQVQRRARAAGMSLGIVHDLAVGVHPSGADAWSLREVLVRGVSVGAPPDQYNQLGQDWSQPPWHPARLAEAGYQPFREMVRGLLRNSGGIRIDHVIGLFRLWWVPHGHGARAGAYVYYDHEALIGILVLEAARARAVLIGEDLGTVPPYAQEHLRERGVLGTSILWFERDGAALRPPESYRELCLASVTTHDLAPTAGLLELAHIELRNELDLLTQPLEEAMATESAALAAVVEALVGRGLVAPDGDREAVVVALHRYLAQTPSKMIGVALSDLIGDRRIINQPGTCDEYPNWRLPLADRDGALLSLEAITQAPLPRRIAARMLAGQ